MYGCRSIPFRDGKCKATRRKLLGLTQEQLAERENIFMQTISYYETGHNAIRPENLSRLYEVLSVSSDCILPRRASVPEANRLTDKTTKLASIESISDVCLCLLERHPSLWILLYHSHRCLQGYYCESAAAAYPLKFAYRFRYRDLDAVRCFSDVLGKVHAALLSRSVRGVRVLRLRHIDW